MLILFTTWIFTLKQIEEKIQNYILYTVLTIDVLLELFALYIIIFK